MSYANIIKWCPTHINGKTLKPNRLLIVYLLFDNPVPIKWEQEQNFRNTDILPKVVLTPATFDDEGNELTPPVYEEGWFVNVRLVGEDGSSLEPFRVEPAHPQRVWA